MKILWLSHLVPYPPKAGVLLRAHYLVKELANYHEVHLLAFNQRALMAPYFESYEAGSASSLEKLSQYCAKVEFVDCPMDRSRFSKISCAAKSLLTKAPYNINWLQDKTFSALVEQWRQQESYDLIHCDTISLASYVEGGGNELLSLDHHNVESHMLLRRSQLENNLLKRIYFWQEGIRLKAYEKRQCPKFNTNLTCSALDTQRLREICPRAAFTEIPNGVDTGVFVPGTEEQDPATFIFIGTLDWYPNTRAVRYIANYLWPIIQREIPNSKMKIIGSGAPQDILDLGKLDPDFQVLGFVDDLKPHLDQATVYLCPIDDGGGTKLKILDALSAGKAVVADEVACEGLNVKDGETVMFASTPDQYLLKIQQLLAQPKLKKSIELNARAHVEQSFSFASIGQNLSEHFSSLSHF